MAGLALVLTLTVFAVPEPLAGTLQEAPAHAEEPVVLEDVEVRGRRGAAAIGPEHELDGAQIDALGVDDIGEVIQRLARDYALGESPVVIVNGRPMADPAVFAGFPPDALVRVEVLPPEAGGLYGADDPSRRVVNIVLQRRFDSREARASVRRPTAGGLSSINADVRQSSIMDTRTRQLGLQAEIDTALRAGERDQDRGDESGGEDVTLRPASGSFAVSLAETASLGGWAASVRANARTWESRSASLRAGEIVESRRRSRGLTMTGGLNGDLAGWSTRLALSGSLSEGDQSGRSPSRTRQQSLSASLALSSALFESPAGPVTANLSGRASQSRSSTERAGGRRTLSGRATGLNGGLSIPLARTPDEGLGRLVGDLTLSLGADLNETDVGRGEGLNAALSWTPLPWLRLAGSWSSSARSVADDQRLEPEYFGDPITVFDFQTGEAVEVLPILGGNPDLRPPSSDRISISASAGPFTAWRLQGGVGLQRAEAADGIGPLPDPTPEVEVAFPERFQRDAGGRLVSIDRRPVNLASALAETLSSNLGFSPPFGGEGALRVSLNHTLQLRNTTTIRADLPEMDRLAGDGGSMPRQTFGLTLDASRGRWRMNTAARWRDGYRIRRDTGQDGPDDLRVAPLGVIDLRISYQFEQDLPTRGGSTRRGVGLQLELEIANLFDARPSASLGDGRAAPGYGRDDQDPIGRTARITLKRRF